MTLHLTSCVYEDQPHPIDLRDLARRLEDGTAAIGGIGDIRSERVERHLNDCDLEAIEIDAKMEELVIWALERCARL